MGKQASKMVSEKQIREEVAEHPVVIYTKPQCGFCTLAKELLDVEKMRYEEKDLDAIRERNPAAYNGYVNGLVYVSRRTSVPQVFICGKFLGGYTELAELCKNKLLWETAGECMNA